MAGLLWLTTFAALADNSLGQQSITAVPVSFLIGALISPFGWIEAGRVSGNDPEAVFALQK